MKIPVISFSVHPVQNLLSSLPVSHSSCDPLVFSGQYEGYVLGSRKIEGASCVLSGQNYLMCDKSREAGNVKCRSDDGNRPVQVELKK